MENFSDYRFYDCEVFSHDYFFVFMNIDKSIDKIFKFPIDSNELKHYIKFKTLVAYNNYSYDDYILSAAMQDVKAEDMKTISDRLINGYESYVQLDTNINSLDCMRQLISFPSLKMLEGNLGQNIYESPIPFDLDRKLTDSEYKMALDYCCNDVKAAIDVFKLRYNSYFVPRNYLYNLLIQQKPNKDSFYTKRSNTTTMSTHLLTDKATEQWSKCRINPREYDKVPQEVSSNWLKVNFNGELPKKSVKYTDFDCNLVFGSGGLHGVPVEKRNKYNDVNVLDVASMYPNLLINLNALEDSTEQFTEIVKTRLKAKREGDKVTAEALKLIINSTYGLLGAKYGNLTNVLASRTTCFSGQIALYDLCKKLYENGNKIINVNTDGVFFTGSNFDWVKKEWEQEYNLELELDHFDHLYQKDVSNYVAWDTGGKHIKAKGGDVRSYNDYANPDEWKATGISWQSNNSLRILHKCLVNKIVYNTSCIDTIYDNLDNPILFQIILKANKTKTLTGMTVDEKGNVLAQRVNRVFATTLKHGRFYKQNIDGCKINFSDLPQNCYLFNDDLSRLQNFKDIVDIGYYQNMANKRLEQWNITEWA